VAAGTRAEWELTRTALELVGGKMTDVQMLIDGE
jgi:hypothetical protein